MYENTDNWMITFPLTFWCVPTMIGQCQCVQGRAPLTRAVAMPNCQFIHIFPGGMTEERQCRISRKGGPHYYFLGIQVFTKIDRSEELTCLL